MLAECRRNLSRPCVQLVKRRGQIHDRSNSAISGLNSLVGFPQERERPSAALTNARAATNRISCAVRGRIASAQHFCPKAVLRELLRLGLVYSFRPGDVAPYDSNLVSIPTDQIGAISLESVLDASSREALQKIDSRMLLTPEELAALAEEPEEPVR